MRLPAFVFWEGVSQPGGCHQEWNRHLLRPGNRHKGNKDRRTMLPKSIVEPIKKQIQRVSVLHTKDIAEGFGRVYLPEALSRKYKNAETEFKWQYLFPSEKRSIDPRSGVERRHHLSRDVLQRAIKRSINRAGIHKKNGFDDFLRLSPLNRSVKTESTL